MKNICYVSGSHHYTVPTMYHFREFAAAGGLVSYGIDARVIYRQIGVYACAILRARDRQSCRSCSQPSSNLSSI